MLSSFQSSHQNPQTHYGRIELSPFSEMLYHFMSDVPHELR